MGEFLAEDITEKYRLREELLAVNSELDKSIAHTKKLLKDISRKNFEEEILDMQRQVHHELGQCIIMLKKYLSGKKDTEIFRDIMKRWRKTFMWKAWRREGGNVSEGKKEIIEAAAIAGCKIVFEGDEPSNETQYRLCLDAVREAVTNAIAHAGADTVNVSGQINGEELIVTVTDNGKKGSIEITEGVGLSSLRRKLESNGIKMETDGKDGVKLKFSFPAVK